ncbi:MAG: hypothetical protein IPK60_14035 [Sandaracinaceae bacterium]|nr:hypothetical protein [Sandaracinaceae bacterium]
MNFSPVSRAFVVVSAFFFGVSACSDPETTPLPNSCPDNAFFSGLEFNHANVGTIVGVTRRDAINLKTDFCDDVEISFSSSNPAVANITGTALIPTGTSQAAVDVLALSEGRTTITATTTHGDFTREATLDVVITPNSVPACAGSALGRVDPGALLTVAAGTSLAGATLGMHEGASRADEFHVDPFDGSIGCATDQVPAGYRALGPAVTFGPAHFRAQREIDLAIPVRTSLLPAGANRSHVVIAYTGPSITEPRIVPIATHAYTGDAENGLLHFQSPRLGTFQAVVKTDAGTPRRRTYKFNGVTGFSMGSMGSAQVGMRHPELFDFVAPLGGPPDFVQALNYFRNFNFGGFCTETERVSDPSGCESGSSLIHTPVNDVLYQHVQDYEHWYYKDEYAGQGGTFDRREWLQIFRDVSFMYGNPNTTRSDDPSEPQITPPGVPDSFREMPDSFRCANPIIIPPHVDGMPTTGYYDDEFNPQGQYPVMTYCDGAEIRLGGERDIGVWDPLGTNDYPAETFMAVDINANGTREPGEPIVRTFWENFSDIGLDGIASADETGYDAATNPDPAGDDFDFQFNPTGTERNGKRDGESCTAGAAGVAEPFNDVGLDGVAGTPQFADGGYDTGEGNGCYDYSAGAGRMFGRNPTGIAYTMDASTLRDLDIFADGGIRDLLNSLPSENNFIGAFGARGFGVHMYNSHQTMDLAGGPEDGNFYFPDVPWAEVGSHAIVRYGDPDASEQLKIDGDGGHVGTATQLINRVIGVLAWMSSRWPDGDRRSVVDTLCKEGSPGCVQPNQFIRDFTSPTTNRTGPVSIVLPPGYYEEENAGLRYPVVYFMHGYGMDPQGLVDLGALVWAFMRLPTIPEARRMQKMIFVFPDGLCRGNECIQGTFYTDAPESTPNGAQMEQWLLDLKGYVDGEFRTRGPDEFDYVE